MKIHQWEIWKARPEGFNTDHWFVVISNQERCDSVRHRAINGLACYKLQGPLLKKDVQLNSADGFAGATACDCEFLHSLDKSKLHSSQGLVSWERQQQIKNKIKETFRL